MNCLACLFISQILKKKNNDLIPIINDCQTKIFINEQKQKSA